MKTRNRLKKGDKIEFVSGNYKGLTGVIIDIKYGLVNTPYGLMYSVKLSNGKIGYIEKSEHWKFV